MEYRLNSQFPTPNSQTEPYAQWGEKSTNQLIRHVFHPALSNGSLGSWELVVGS
jgi:hypothetical protein